MRDRMNAEAGFTLIELVVVTAVLGVLAALALPTLGSQANKGSDAVAIEGVANLQRELEACYAETNDYTHCATVDVASGPADKGKGNGKGKGRTKTASEPGGVGVSALTATTYTLKATSNAATRGTHHVFLLERKPDGSYERTCSPRESGGCGGGTW